MIHLALMVAAFLFLSGVAMAILAILFTLVGAGFHKSKGYGFAAAGVALVIVAGIVAAGAHVVRS